MKDEKACPIPRSEERELQGPAELNSSGHRTAENKIGEANLMFGGLRSEISIGIRIKRRLDSRRRRGRRLHFQTHHFYLYLLLKFPVRYPNRCRLHLLLPAIKHLILE
uniref:Uncharacterized protein n=1 Tax=Salix viminalis TaxID=40686 RepID=A0A6N2M5A9_SALVM